MTVAETSLLTRIEHVAGARTGAITFVGSNASKKFSSVGSNLS